MGTHQPVHPTLAVCCPQRENAGHGHQGSPLKLMSQDSVGSIIVIGATDVGRRTCAALSERGVDVTHLSAPSDVELHRQLDGDVIGVAVMLHNDIEALRYSLAVEHIKPGVRLFVAIFDRSVRHEMERTIPNCFVASPAYVALPSIVAAALMSEHGAIVRTGSAESPTWEVVTVENGSVRHSDFSVPLSWRRQRIWSLCTGQFRSYDSASRALLGGLAALVLTGLVDMAILLQHEPLSKAFYSAAAVISSVTAPETPEQKWRLLQSGLFMILTVVFLAIFGAGVVNHVLTGRRAGIVGRRVIPRTGHVVVAGLGQVGIRLCKELSLLKIPVVAIEQKEGTGEVLLAKDLGIPVITGNASDVRTMKRARVSHARALFAMSSEEQDNIAVSVAARAIAPSTPIILRAGNNDAIAETRSLFSIGVVSDINGMTASYVAQSLLDSAPKVVLPSDTHFTSVASDYSADVYSIPGRCSCYGNTL